MKNLLTLTAVIEAGTGVLLLTFPSILSGILLGSSLDAPAALTIARIAGAAIFALGVACWLNRNDVQSKAARGLVAALLIYNAGISVVLIHAGLRSGLSGIGLWSVVTVHISMSVWCIVNLNIKRSK
jgi:hypothetical protein